MTPGVSLFANLGAEEGARWRKSASDPRVEQAARLWTTLFSRTSRRIDSGHRPTWPSSLGPRRPGPAFPWLADGDAVVPWLCTEEAQEQAAAEGLALHGASPKLTRLVHDKAFSQRIAASENLCPQTLRNCIATLAPEDFRDLPTARTRLQEVCAGWPAWARSRFTLKPRLGSSGRGRLAGRDGVLDPVDLEGALRRFRDCGGGILEPWLDRTRDLSAELYVNKSGPPLLLGTVEQQLSPAGLYRGHRGWVDSRGRVFSGLDADEEVREAAAILANAARREGYHGPAGLDAFLFRPPESADSSPREILRPVVEFNARFTMGIVVLGIVRAAIERIRVSQALHPEVRLAFFFSLDEPSGGWDDGAVSARPGTHWFPLWQEGDEAHPGLVIGEAAKHLSAT